MDLKVEDEINLRKQNFSFLGQNDSFVGDLSLNNETFICSKVDGSINLKSTNRLVIEPSGHILGKVNCHLLEIYGQIEGEIVANSKVILYPSAVVKGSIKTKTLEIHPGAILEGDSHTIQ
ncbi:MAG: bactofilin family protein [Bacteriovoracaceae bacterium]